MILTLLIHSLCSIVGAFAIETSANAFSSILFDYIVVGGGTTGLSLASRLSDNGCLVGVIEAGNRIEDNNILVPALIGSALGDPNYDWLLSTTPQAQLYNRTIGLGRGKLLGGTSAMNFLGYSRASMNEYDGWKALGNAGWSFDEMLHFMRASELWTPADKEMVQEFNANNDANNHGTSGSLLTTPYANYSNLVPPFFSTLENLGIPQNKASHGGNTIGSWSITATLDPHNRTRSYSTTAYYNPRSSRENLFILTGAQVVKVNFSERLHSYGRRRAISVQYVARGNETHFAVASREIILSAGTLKTPQILELSGIGNATILQRLQLPVVIDLPGVGENLQDHPGVTASFQTLMNMTTWDELADSAIAAQQFEQYSRNRTGLYSATASSVAFITWKQFMHPDVVADLKQQLDEALASETRFNTSTFRLQRSWIDDETVPQLEIIMFPENSNTAGSTSTNSKDKFYTLSMLFQHSWSRGKVHVISHDGLVPPRIDTKYLEAPADIDAKVFVHALRFALNISQTEPMKSFTSSIVGPNLMSTDDDLLAWTRDHLSTNFHLVGTAAMLPMEEGGVVDNHFIVHGTANLRIVDASIYPLHVATHPVATLYGMAEKAADLIISSYQCRG